MLINALERLDYAEEGFQVHICEGCGIPGCADRSWASLRKLGDAGVPVPSVSLMRGDMGYRYGPPDFMLDCGVPMFSKRSYEALLLAADRLPPWERIKPFTAMDALAAHQMAAPEKLLGELGETATLKSELCLAVTDGETVDEMSALQRLLSDVESGTEARFSVDPDRVVEFHLDLPGFPTWAGLGYVNSDPVFNVRPWLP